MLLMACVTLYSQLSARIVGPTSAAPGDLVVLEADADAADQFAWQVAPELDAGRLTILPIESGRKCLIASTPGTYTIFLAVANDKSIAATKHVVTIGNVPPDPKPVPPKPPTPNPPNPPPPTPPTPDSKFGLAKQARQWVIDLVPTAEQPKAGKLAESCRELASIIASGVLSQPQAILNEAGVRMDRTIGPKDGPWGAWRKRLRQFIEEMIRADRLRSTEDIKVLIEELASGLESAS